MIGRTLTLSCNKNEAPYVDSVHKNLWCSTMRTLLSLICECLNFQFKILFFYVNILRDGLRIRNEITVARIIAQSAGKADLIGYNCFERMKVYIFMAWDFVYLSYYVLFLKWMYFFL
uniref:Uncharacterized protein n=1 Tax=Heterorhabditis bacteriophora TaxID=37862 RepID=A0A1I7WA00_HETBA